MMNWFEGWRRITRRHPSPHKSGHGGLPVQLTKDATKVSRAQHECLRQAGFDDRGILQITLIAAWFNYINRVADALGVGREG